MVQLIALIVFILSFGLLAFILYRKIPSLVQLPQNGHHGFKKPKFVSKWEKKARDMHFNLFEKQMFLHKVLSKTKVWILKTENKVDTLLHGIRKKAQKLEKTTKRKRSAR